MTLLLDIMLLLVGLEAAAVVWLRFKRGELRALPGDFVSVGSGFCLMLAVRIAWTNSSAIAVILLISLAGVVHAFDMTRRLGAAEPAQKKAPQPGRP